MKKKPMNEAQLLELLKLVLPKATEDPRLAMKIFTAVEKELKLVTRVENFQKFCAKVELPARAWELAAVTGVEVKVVTVRNQRSRWGSCSANGTISLNWRLVQTPDFVRDYIIFHELINILMRHD